MRSILRVTTIIIIALVVTSYGGLSNLALAAPAISVSPTSGITGAIVSVTGSGFGPGETGITVTYDGTVVASGIAANPAGAWSASFAVPASSSGAHSIVAAGSVTPAVGGISFNVNPSFATSHTSGAPGTVISVAGSGYAASESPITVTYDGLAIASGVRASAQGSWSVSFAIPPSSAGSHTVGATGATTPSMSATFTVVSGITISQGSGPSGTSLTVTGFAFAAGETGITVTYDGTSVATGISANSQGGWTATLTVPPSPAGAHAIRASGSVTPATRDQTFSVTATVSINRAGGAPGSSVSVSGTGFASGETGITVTYDSAPAATGLSANSQGSWNTNIVIPASPGGPHALRAYGPTTPASATPDLVFVVGPGASLSQASGPPGNSLTVTGAGFGASETGITVTYDGTTVASAIKASATGSWNASFVVPPSASGPHTIRTYGSIASNVPDVTFTVRPAVATSLANGTPGGPITVSGTGFGASETGITVTYDGTTVASGIRASPQGSWSTSLIVPASATGPHAVHAYGSITSTASTSDVILSIVPSVTIAQASGVPGNSITVAGAGFGASETGITVTFDGVTVASGVRANAQGSWTSTFAIPASASGTHVIHTYGSATLAASTSDVAFTVNPGISVNQPGGAPGTLITVTGAGFGTGETGITVTYDGGTVASGIRANPQGGWTTSFIVPASAAGLHSIKASGSVTQAGGLSEAGFNTAPGISLDPHVGYVGMAVQVTGGGFAANSLVTFSYDDKALPIQGVTSDGTGSFSQSLTIPKSKAGNHTIRAVDAQKNESKATFTIDSIPPAAPVPLSPPDGTRIGILGGTMPTFRWSAVSDPNGVTYVLEVDCYPDFSQPVLSKTELSATRYTLVAAEALPRGEYYWRVKAVNGASVESAWSQTVVLQSGLLPLWGLLSIIAALVAGAGVGVYYVLIVRPRARRREALAVPALEAPQVVSAQWRLIEPPAQATAERRLLPWRLALPDPAKGEKAVSMEDQARLLVIIDFAQSLPLLEPGYNVRWLIDLVETATGAPASADVYAQLLKGMLQVRYEPAWMHHPTYEDLISLLEGQPVVEDLRRFVDAVNLCASEVISLLQEIRADANADGPPDLLENGGWGYIAAVYADAINWFRGKSLREPSERDYSIDAGPGGDDQRAFTLSGAESTPFAGVLAYAADDTNAERLRSLHLNLRRTYRNSSHSKQVAVMLAQLEVQRTRLLSVFSQLGSLRR